MYMANMYIQVCKLPRIGPGLNLSVRLAAERSRDNALLSRDRSKKGGKHLIGVYFLKVLHA